MRGWSNSWLVSLPSHRGREPRLAPSLSSSRTCLPDLAPWRYEQHHCCLTAGLPRLHRADPSTSLDKSILFICGCHYSRFSPSCQVELDDDWSCGMLGSEQPRRLLKASNLSLRRKGAKKRNCINNLCVFASLREKQWRHGYGTLENTEIGRAHV